MNGIMNIMYEIDGATMYELNGKYYVEDEQNTAEFETEEDAIEEMNRLTSEWNELF